MGLIDDIATGVFQFHNGTINTDLKAWSDHLISMFQFHNGTINTFSV